MENELNDDGSSNNPWTRVSNKLKN